MKNVWMLLALLFPSLASAHPGHSEVGFLSGMLHPLSGVDHVAAMMGIGLVCSLYFGRDKSMKWVSLSVLALSLVFGAGIAVTGFFIPMFESLIALSVVLVGVVLTFGVSGRQLSRWLVYMLASFACFHGYVHLFEMPTNAAVMLYILGFVAASAALYFVGFILGAQFESPESKKKAFLYSGSMYLAMTAMFLV
ncbi:HupE/UreJ family protein [Vibrio mediterranei]|uniref:HupE/UreJ family protein n=1 Tax=Vibrio mediterranei TaxID=689 RepID=UPI001EFCE96D|nr:HupE/UreJ family protein [Vibrio mediterranei]MCG9627982.1 HupE/UreJ family protein [Vibrio mediterranei]